MAIQWTKLSPLGSVIEWMMRILHVVPTYYPAVRYGGPIWSVHGLAKGLVRRGHEVHVFTTNIDGSSRLPVSANKPLDVDGVAVWYFPTGLGRRLYRSPMMRRALDEHISEFDVVHLHSVFLWPTSAAASAARRAHVPYLLAPRGMLVRDLIRRKSRLAKTSWIAMFEKRNIANAAGVHVTSESEAADLADLGFRHERIITIPNGVETPRGNGNAPATATVSEIVSSPFILFLGRINWKKGLDRLIPAMADVPGAKLLVVGNDEEGYQTVLQALAERVGVADRTQFVGPLYGSAKWRLLAQATMLVLPSYSENFGNVVLEAMVVGCPVIVTPQVGLANVVRAAGAGLVVDGDPAELSRAINLLLQAPERRRKLGEAGRRIAEDKFSWDAIAAEMERVYRSCVGEDKHCEVD